MKGKPQHGSRLVALEPAGGNQWRGVLESDPPLEEGRWDTCLVGAAEEDRTALLPGLRDLRALVSGGEAEHSAPLAVRVPYVTKDGRLAVRAWYRAVHAEAGRIVVEDDVISVTARLLGAQFGDGAAVSLRRRGPGAVARRIPLRPGAKGDFVFTMNCREFTADSAGPGPGTEVAVWDVYVHPDADAPRVRVARLLDDLADRKPVFVYPTAVGDGVTARPYYTVDNDLSVEVASASGP
ncbi:hypothetical protein ACIPSE_31835 [Streptomyces sp. NPDC090106]|uniref:hypothetical protein n=1 Tax=Streptomyces sp. NPDC090106 TaxID=3365946 RepID=UPI00380F723D